MLPKGIETNLVAYWRCYSTIRIVLLFDASKLVSSDSPWFITHHGSLTSRDPPAPLGIHAPALSTDRVLFALQCTEYCTAQRSETHFSAAQVAARRLDDDICGTSAVIGRGPSSALIRWAMKLCFLPTSSLLSQPYRCLRSLNRWVLEGRRRFEFRALPCVILAATFPAVHPPSISTRDVQRATHSLV